MNTKRILHTWSVGLLFAGAMLLTFVSCMDDDLAKKNGDVVEGVPITVTMKLAGTPAADVTVNTRADDTSSELIDNLAIFVFHGDGSYEHYVSTRATGDNQLKCIPGNDGLCSVSFKTTSGVKNMIAVANTSEAAGEGGFWELTAVQSDVVNGKYSFDQLKSILINLREDNISQPIQIISASQMMMAGWNTGVEFDTGGNVTGYGTDGIEKSQVVVKMDRTMSRITFNIKAALDNAKGVFTPVSYRVYNIPVQSYLTNKEVENSGNKDLTSGIENVRYIHFDSSNIGTVSGGNYSFTFFMPENVQEEKNLTEYLKRDEWEGTGNTPEGKKWSNAPQNSTFVVISGTYSQSSTDGSPSYTGNVNYTIHLGGFTDKTQMGNFSVERNCSYTYNVSVLGVDKIIVEAERKNDEYQQGAEGEIFDASEVKYNYQLDAHYEKVYLEFDLTQLANQLASGLTDADLDKAIADKMNIVIQSEAMDKNHTSSDSEPYSIVNKRASLSPYGISTTGGVEKEKVMSNIDYKWLEFWPQSEGKLASYPGVPSWNIPKDHATLFAPDPFASYTPDADANKLLDVYDVIVEMGKAVKQIYTDNNTTPTSNLITISNDGGSYKARFTVFINEYYYYLHPLTGKPITQWSAMTNKIPRELYVWLNSDVSTDGNSILSKPHTIISQVSMETPYSDRSTNMNAFGLETYNETPIASSSGFTFGNVPGGASLDANNGRSNQKALISFFNDGFLKWDDFITSENNGYTSTITGDHSVHKLNDAYVTKRYKEACLSRNRDLNGNGFIDDNEIRWYLPSSNEYMRMGLAAQAISSTAQLYIGDKSNMSGATNNYPKDYYSYGSIFFTSSVDDERFYWAVEKGSVGGEYEDLGLTVSTPLPIRCVRVLPAINEGGKNVASLDVTPASFNVPWTDEENKVLQFKGRMVESMYRMRTDAPLDEHNEDGAANRYSDGIIIAKQNLGKKYTVAQIAGLDYGNVTNSKRDPCAGGYYENRNYVTGYSEKDDGSDLGTWRVPNLNELAMMGRAYPNEFTNHLCCTKFSYPSVRYGFRTVGDGRISCGSLSDDGYGTYFDGRNYPRSWVGLNIRCVRDVPEGYEFGNK